MTVSLKATTFNVALTTGLTKNLDLQTVQTDLPIKYSASLTNGTGANKAGMIWSDTRTLAASGTEDLDLSGVLTDAFGVAIVFTKIKSITITAAAANTNYVNMSCPAANGFVTLFLAASDGIRVAPGGCIAIMNPSAAGYAVTAGTGDLLTITNSAGGTSVTYNISIIGEV